METNSKNSILKSLILWYIGTGLVLYMVEIALLNERQWYGADGHLSLLQIVLQLLGRLVAWPIEILFGINRLGFSADGLYGSWFFLGITLVSLAIGLWIVRKRIRKTT